MFPFATSPATAHVVHAGVEAAAMALGARAYLRARRRTGAPSVLAGPSFWVLLGCLLGAAIGNKVVFWLEQPQLLADAHGLALVLAGQSMVGGLLGGLLGTELAKALTGVRTSTGDLFVEPLLLGMAVGRVGCFLAGLHDGTHGLPTSLPVGIDLGDGVPRHPTQLYEIAFVGLLALALREARPWTARVPGLSFKLMLSAYLAWRFLVDSWKPVPFRWPLGLSGIQWTCIAALALYAPLTLRALWRLRHVATDPALPVP